MLTLTENADAVVTTIVGREDAGAEAGLRIQTAEGQGPNGEARFAVHVVPTPEPADVVVEGQGSRVFLEDVAADALSDKVLDAGVDEQGAVSFTILAQPA
ncbi:Fe-S cluster assembly protein HesB [Microbacterium sp. NPDC077644]|uniref:Fe-S cluster assembly protein HesB n=1 Tax=Microbacterium tenebrionis TaxID=2830665 RepID=A0A9X1LPJ9_9MICO|nr:MULTISPECIES: Fe-S cluster assembly protein HesB [Microbacterium]MCC2029432.1 Fe-S cluster assembly protein HesB [Microbacterium tenebrionis]